MQESHGPIRVLALGVDAYLPHSGFATITQCATDAAQIHQAFAEVRQLNGNLEHLVLMNADTPKRPPVRGHILAQLQELAAGAGPEERILFYFSGHGHTITGMDDQFLVPADAFDADDPGALVSLRKVREILENSEAKQKIIILDACKSGPTLLGKKLRAAKHSETFLADYLKATRGFAVLSACAADEASYTKSPNPKLSLFTHFLSKALHGDPEALDGQMLTLPGLFEYVSTEVRRKTRDYHIQQTPSLENTVDGVMMLADFRMPLVAASPLDLGKDRFVAFVFQDSSPVQVREILTQWRNTVRTMEQLEYAANQKGALGPFLSERFGRWSPVLRRTFGLSSGNIDVEGGTLSFSGVKVTHRYEAKNKDRGVLLREVSVDIDWASDGEKLLRLLDILEMRSRAFGITLKVDLDPVAQVHGLEAAGWTTEMETPGCVEVSKGHYTMTITSDGLRFGGFGLGPILTGGDAPGSERSELAAAIGIVCPPAGAAR